MTSQGRERQERRKVYIVAEISRKPTNRRKTDKVLLFSCTLQRQPLKHGGRGRNPSHFPKRACSADWESIDRAQHWNRGVFTGGCLVCDFQHLADYRIRTGLGQRPLSRRWLSTNFYGTTKMMQTPSAPAANPAPPSPPASFDTLALSPETRKALAAFGYQTPTPVQLAVFGPAAEGKDLVVQARTGTGKTLAFGLPLLETRVNNKDGIQALVLTPTRELALQVANELRRFATPRGLSIATIYGGAPMQPQIDELGNRPTMVVGTPGRVLDHLRRGTLVCSTVRALVLDEADEMLSMGFAKELSAIIGFLPADRQGLFFSATLPPDIERMARDRLRSPEFITLSSDQVGALSIEHYAYHVGADKQAALLRVIEVENPESAVVFCNKKDDTERVATTLKNAGFEADWLNGDLEQKERERVMAATRAGRLRFLVATDVAARGIDISHLTHVINFDFPESAEAYVHRTGRTGRAGKTGTALSLVGPKDVGNLYLLRLTYKLRPIERKLPSEVELRTRAELDVVAVLEDVARAGVQKEDLAVAERLLSHENAAPIVAALLRAFLGEQAEDPSAKRRSMKPPPANVAAVPAFATGNKAGTGRSTRDPLPKAATSRAAENGRAAPWEPKPSAKTLQKAPDDGGTPLAVSLAVTPASSAVTPEVIQSAANPGDVGAPPRKKAYEATWKTPESPRVLENDPNYTQIYLNVGKRDGFSVDKLVELLKSEGAMADVDLGTVRLKDRMAFIAVRNSAVPALLAALRDKQVDGRPIAAEPAKVR
jgi:superfamily II DNA/RNA helicase